jgi:hypothetical protein
VAKTSLWAEIQRERARQQCIREQEFRAFRQAQERAQREQARTAKAAARKAAADLKEAKRLHLEERKAEAEEMSQALQDRVTELDGVLTAGIRTGLSAAWGPPCPGSSPAGVPLARPWTSSSAHVSIVTGSTLTRAATLPASPWPPNFLPRCWQT